MLRLFFASQLRGLRLWLGLFASPWREGRAGWAALLLLLAWPLWMLLQLLHWLGFALDELLFRGWRRVEIRRPLFVLGPPRSGTTHLHHALALDPDCTTFRLWEGLFGLSVTGRRLTLALLGLDRAIGGPAAALGRWLGRRFGAALDDVHPLALDAPEEDFLTLLPTMQCFILIAVFPRAEWLWRFARLDVAGSERERREWARWYRACVAKHLYVFGEEKYFLSKNASFAGLTETLLEAFPDARIIACDRDPQQVVPSQLSSLRPALQAVGFARMPVELRDRLVDLLEFDYLQLQRAAAQHPERIVIVANADLKDRLAVTVTDALKRLDRAPGAEFLARLEQASSRSRGFRSAHHYSAAEFDLSEAWIAHRFAAVNRGRERWADIGRGEPGHV
jgi:hypothetical protein